MRVVLSLLLLPALVAVVTGQGADTDLDGPAVIEFFRQRIQSPEQARQLQHDLGQLGAGDYAERTAANARLAKCGEQARPLLQQALEGGKLDLEAQRRVRQLLQQIPVGKDTARTMHALRRLLQLRPAGSAVLVLDYLPFVPNETVRQDAQAALNALAADGRAALTAALAEANPLRRAAAAEALIRAGLLEAKQIPALLRDPQRAVRLQAALAVIEMQDPIGVPVLIDLLPELPPEQAALALELLGRVAGADALATPDRAAWLAWYEAHRGNLDLATRFQRPDHGLTVISHAGGAGKSWIVGLGLDGKERWRFDGTRLPVDVQVLGKGRLLIAEYAGQKVTERDFQGQILWEKALDHPIACQRLPDGKTFIATKKHLCIVAADGQEIFAGFSEHSGLTTATRLRDGRMLAVTTDGRCHLLDAAGQPLHSFPIGSGSMVGNHLDVLPNGHILAASMKDNRVAEFDLTGKIHWQAQVIGPSSAQRLANGNTLVVGMRTNQIIEIAPDGAERWDRFTDGRPWRARRW